MRIIKFKKWGEIPTFLFFEQFILIFHIYIIDIDGKIFIILSISIKPKPPGLQEEKEII